MTAGTETMRVCSLRAWYQRCYRDLRTRTAIAELHRLRFISTAPEYITNLLKIQREFKNNCEWFNLYSVLVYYYKQRHQSQCQMHGQITRHGPRPQTCKRPPDFSFLGKHPDRESHCVVMLCLFVSLLCLFVVAWLTFVSSFKNITCLQSC